MDTKGLQGMWGLEQLERTGLGTFSSGLILLATFVVVNLLMLGPDFGFVYSLVFGVLESVGLLGVLYISRTTQSDLEQLHSFDNGAATSIDKLRPSKGVMLVFFAVNLAIYWLVIAVAVTRVMGIGLVDFHRDIVMGRPGWIAAWYGAGPLWGICSGIAWSVVVAQGRALSHAARTVEIHVIHLDRYAHIAHPLVRIVVFLMVMASISPLFAFFIDDRAYDRIVAVSTPSTLATALILVAFYAYPVWLLRGRIRQAKQQEVNRILAALDGDETAMALSRVGGRAGGMSVIELLAYRNFVDSLWDWPVAPYVQRVILVGLLPPLTWVMAGLVENALGVLMGVS